MQRKQESGASGLNQVEMNNLLKGITTSMDDKLLPKLELGGTMEMVDMDESMFEMSSDEEEV
jgi:hypothetical protein